MSSELDIVNGVLTELGKLPVARITDSDDALYISKVLTRIYPQMLNLYTWNWASIYRIDNTPTSPNVSDEFTYTYKLPGDFARFFKFANYLYNINYDIVNRYLLTNAKPIAYWYISNQISYTYLPVLFEQMLILNVAAISAPTRTQNANLASYLWNRFNDAKALAIEWDAYNQPISGLPYNEYNRIDLV